MRTSPHRREKIVDVISRAAAEFIQKESNRNSMITVTNIGLTDDFQKAIVFVTVFPEDQEQVAIDFLHRKLREFRNFIKKETRLQNIPWFDFQIDGGEKKRQRIDEISKSI